MVDEREGYLWQLGARLQVLRRFFTICSIVSASSADVDLLWAALSPEPLELDELFQFLKVSHAHRVDAASVNQPHVCSPEVALEVFRKYICSQSVDWSQCGPQALECFYAYFSHLDHLPSEERDALRECGLSALWRIALQTSSEAAIQEVIDWLIRAYETGASTAYAQLLEAVFVHLGGIQQRVEFAGADVSLSPPDALCLSRCVRILQTAILRGKGRAGLAHSVRGRMSRIHITVYYRRLSLHYNHVTHSDSLRADKGWEGSVSLEVHPHFTVLQLKELLVAKTSILAEMGDISVEHTSSRMVAVTDNTRLFELEVSDGADLSVSYQSASYLRGGRHMNSVTEVHGQAFPDPEDGLDEAAASAAVIQDSDLSTGDGAHVGQLLSSDYSQFDCLLTLCEQYGAKHPDIGHAIWELLMLVPTQNDLLAQTLQQVSSTADSLAAPERVAHCHVLDSCTSVTRASYFLQIMDSLLQPAPELMLQQLDGSGDDVAANARVFREAFLASGGFPSVLRVLIETPADGSVASNTALPVALHIIHFLLFGSPVSGALVSGLIEDDDDDDNDDLSLASLGDSPFAVAEAPAAIAIGADRDSLLEQVCAQSVQVIGKLLHVAKSAASSGNSSTVHDALAVATRLIRDPAVASQLIGDGECKALLTTVLRSPVKKVRVLAAEFAVQIGKSQPVAFSWLLEELRRLTPTDGPHCREFFCALTTLAMTLSLRPEDHTAIACILSDRLLNYATAKACADTTKVADSTNDDNDESNLLLGYLELLNCVLRLQPEAVTSTDLGQHLVPVILHQFLFVMPDATSCGSAKPALCDSPATRRAAFAVLTSYVDLSLPGFEAVMADLATLCGQAARGLKHCWGVHVQHDIRPADAAFSGLKNQGCTCYMNSLLQQLFMNAGFREAILAAPLPESLRTTLWHKSGAELVGCAVLFEQVGGEWRAGQVLSFDSDTGHHTITYMSPDGSVEEEARFNIHSGRFQRETGRVRLVPPETTVNAITVSEREDAAYRVLEQLQRTFCFMKHSNRRCFDPRPFVDACKTLNLNFNVYHQNDAAEFCDQLLDRIETATKGKHSHVDVWTDVLLNEVFGGQWLYEKIPQECEAYRADKAGCGHFQGSRLESFLKVELMIRGKEHIAESLSELVQGELMDGENKIQCDVCCQKKATTRRTCFGALPNSLVLHLKRFDLDFTTFETVKLNNRLEFPSRINLLPYAKEGIETAELLAQREAEEAAENTGEGEGPEEPDRVSSEERGELGARAEDFEYVLQGVLVHAGIAQGGHYYSFARQDTAEGEGRWFRFDDEDVTPFDHEHIPAQCFGGPQISNSSGMIGEDRASNALMLFYNKVRRQVSPESVRKTDAPPCRDTDTSSSKTSLVSGTAAFEREVQESNVQHLLSCYLVDQDLHSFVRSLLAAVAQRPDGGQSGWRWSLDSSTNDLPLRTVQFTCNFLLDTLMHYRERTAMRASALALKDAFEAHPHTALWFLTNTLTPGCSWLADYLEKCSDALARASFVLLLVQAVQVIAPRDQCALLPSSNGHSSPNSDCATLVCARLVAALMRLIPRAVNHVRTSDELFMLVRDLAATVSCVCVALQSSGCIAFLSYFVLPAADIHSAEVLAAFERATLASANARPQSQQSSRYEFAPLHQSVLEAMAALLGVPQVRKVSLLQDRVMSWEADLVPEAREALSLVFAEVSRGGGMDAHDLTRYLERVGQYKPSPAQVRNILDRFLTSNDGRLTLEGFLQYHADTASYNPKTVWRDLHAFGFRNDLTRSVSTTGGGEGVDDSFASIALCDGEHATMDSSADATPEKELRLTEQCHFSLSRIALYEAGMVASEASVRAIAQRVCLRNQFVSSQLMEQALEKLHAAASESTWTNTQCSAIMDFIRMMLGVPDDLLARRLFIALTCPHGLATVPLSERNEPSRCRANEFNRFALHDKFVTFAQEIIQGVPAVVPALRETAASQPAVNYLLGLLRLRGPDNLLTENELRAVSSTVVVVEGAGVPEVDGEYIFTTFKNSAGQYERRGPYGDVPDARFAIYKCSLKNGGFQWFLSITPPSIDPGTAQDLDFYYATAKAGDKLPSSHWHSMNISTTRPPAPRVECVRADPEEALDMSMDCAPSSSGYGPHSGDFSDNDSGKVDDDEEEDDDDDDNDSGGAVIAMDGLNDDSFVNDNDFFYD